MRCGVTTNANVPDLIIRKYHDNNSIGKIAEIKLRKSTASNMNE